jgi:regulator of replication initiation timing
MSCGAGNTAASWIRHTGNQLVEENRKLQTRVAALERRLDELSPPASTGSGEEPPRVK